MKWKAKKKRFIQHFISWEKKKRCTEATVSVDAVKTEAFRSILDEIWEHARRLAEERESERNRVSKQTNETNESRSFFHFTDNTKHIHWLSHSCVDLVSHGSLSLSFAACLRSGRVCVCVWMCLCLCLDSCTAREPLEQQLELDIYIQAEYKAKGPLSFAQSTATHVFLLGEQFHIFHR